MSTLNDNNSGDKNAHYLDKIRTLELERNRIDMEKEAGKQVLVNFSCLVRNRKELPELKEFKDLNILEIHTDIHTIAETLCTKGNANKQLLTKLKHGFAHLHRIQDCRKKLN